MLLLFSRSSLGFAGFRLVEVLLAGRSQVACFFYFLFFCVAFAVLALRGRVRFPHVELAHHVCDACLACGFVASGSKRASPVCRVKRASELAQLPAVQNKRSTVFFLAFLFSVLWSTYPQQLAAATRPNGCFSCSNRAKPNTTWQPGVEAIWPRGGGGVGGRQHSW